MAKDLIKYITGYAPEIIDGNHIDIAIEFNIDLFKELGIKTIPHTEECYIETEIGSFYCCYPHENTSWFWAVTKKTLNTRKFNSIGIFYLTDGDGSTNINTRKKIWSKFKKDLEPGLIKALKDFYRRRRL